MIVAVGIDVVLVDRFARALARTPLLADRLFTEAERLHPLRQPALAGVAGRPVRGQGGGGQGARRPGRAAAGTTARSSPTRTGGPG